MDKRPIGLFDSGVGGLSVLREIADLLPLENFVYVADQKHVPYGGKSQTELEKLTEQISRFLIGKQVKMIVIACNTATVYALNHLRQKFTLPIVGVVPVVKTLAEKTKTGKTAVLATPATSKSSYLQALIQKFAPEKTVYCIGGTGLEEVVESGEVDSPEVERRLKEFLTPLLEKDVDCLALGCTHYPFLREKIEDIVGDKMQVFDSGPAVARQVKRILETNQILSNEKGEDFYFTSGETAKFKEVAEKLLQQEIKNIAQVAIKL